jgi:succinoglycan biosynthesis transport protein ExoP
MAANDPKSDSGGHGDTPAFLGAIRDRGLLVLTVCAVAVAAVMTYLIASPDHYESEADVLVTPITDDDEALKGLGLLNDPSGSVYTAARLLDRPQVVERVNERLNLNLSRKELLSKVEITPQPQSDLVTIGAVESSPERAAVLANSFARELIEERTQVFQRRLSSAIERQRARAQAARVRSSRGTGSDDTARFLEERVAEMESYQGAADPTLRISSSAVAPDEAKSRSLLGIAVALLGAALVATGAVLLIEFLNPRIRRRSPLPDGLTSLAHVRALPPRTLKRALSGKGSLPEPVWDTWRLVRTRLATTWSDREPSTVVLVTSARRNEGKTVTACCLAVATAAAGVRVTLVDANLRDPELADLFGIESEVGLADVLQGGVRPRDGLIEASGFPGLKLLPAGTSSQQIVDLLERRRIEELFAELKREGEVVIVEAPALNGNAEAVALAASADLVIGSARSGQTRLADVQEFHAMLRTLGVPVLGMVVHERRRARGRLVPTPTFRDPTLELERSHLRSEVA